MILMSVLTHEMKIHLKPVLKLENEVLLSRKPKDTTTNGLRNKWMDERASSLS